ncbi:hypothetical protein [Alkalibacillus aidingensis]|uniref:hypothetical protein n=1 Tax=Alkalibacillus aidingensis TaxID=2747607 RepID=UPI001660A94F|nr:hypothetical protein [Alkalibacillus aidingensis]
MKDFIHKYTYLEKKKDARGNEKVYIQSTDVEPRHLYQFGTLEEVIKQWDHLTEDEIKEAFDYEEKRLYPERFIPDGPYCYDKNGTCPFWDIDLKRDTDENGYCHYLHIGDWEDDDEPSQLYQKCKACDINLEDQGEQKDLSDKEYELYVNGELIGSSDLNEIHLLLKDFFASNQVDSEADIKVVEKK